MVWHYALTPLSRHSFATSSWAVAPCAASSVLPSTGLQLHSAAAKLLQSCPTLCDLIDGSPPGSPVSGILQARTLEWVAISLSSAWKWKVNVKSLSHVRLLATHGLQPARLFRPWDFPGKSTGVGAMPSPQLHSSIPSSQVTTFCESPLDFLCRISLFVSSVKFSVALSQGTFFVLVTLFPYRLCYD